MKIQHYSLNTDAEKYYFKLLSTIVLRRQDLYRMKRIEKKR